MRVDIVLARDHRPEHYHDFLNGYRAIRLVDDEGAICGELVWRLASRWRATVEIKEFGISRPEDRRKGWGSRLLEAAIEDMSDYIGQLNLGYRFWRIYLFCEARNKEAHAFYEARGFQREAVPKDFYGEEDGDDAIIYSRTME